MSELQVVRTLELDQARYFRDRLREARATALRDAEGYAQILMWLERLGGYLLPEARGLHARGAGLERLAAVSPLASVVPGNHRTVHTPFPHLLALVRLGRNEAVHEGASARHLTANAVALSLVVEDALMSEAILVRDYMVPSPTCASCWEPISLVRQKLLTNAFSYVPVSIDDPEGATWYLVSDRMLAAFLRPPLGDETSNGERRRRLSATLGEVFATGALQPEKANCFTASTPIHEVVERLDQAPALIVDDADQTRLVGILTAFDLL